MKHETQSLIATAAVGAAAVAAAAAIALPGRAFASDITVDPSPFASTRSRDEVRQELLGPGARLQVDTSEWSLQQGSVLKARAAASQVRADFIAHRREVSAFTGEDSGSFVLKMKPLPDGGAAVMGGPR